MSEKKQPPCLINRSRLVELLLGYISANSTAVSGPDMHSHLHILNCMALAADEGVAQASGSGTVSTLQLEQVRSSLIAVIEHAISLGFEADVFLSCWREGDWAGCASFGFPVDSRGYPYV